MQLLHNTPDYARPTLGRLLRTAIIGSFLWFSPLIVLLMLFGPQNVFTTIAAFNSKMAVVTFGGAYSVLAYMAQQAVQHYHWLKPGEMLVGLGFAETTPGPLISVVQFVGFVAALHHSGSLNPVLAGMLGGMLAMWSTFVPSFLWIFLGGPYMEALIDNRILNAALTTITAAVVGVVLNLAVWFALHTLFDVVDQRHVFVLMLNIPVWSTINWPTVVISLAAMIAIFRFKAGMISVLASSSVAGIAYYLALGAP